MIDLEIKSQLAKLLATEDLIVENSPTCTTASFDVDGRVLTLPIWKRASGIVYDLLVGHEVGHALFTPNIDPPEDVPIQFINVTEDVRIEKLIKRKYPGLNKTFYRGYQEMVADNFFEVDEDKIPQMNLADRANLHFKGGNFMCIPFLDEEKEILNLIAKAETFDEACDAARVLYEYCKSEVQQQKQQPQQPNPEGKKESTLSSGTSDKTEESEEKSEQKEQQQELEVQTDQALEQNLQQLVEPTHRSSIYAEIPDINLEDFVIDNARVHKEIGAYYAEQLEPMFFEDAYGVKQKTCADFSKVDNDYKQFKNSAQKEVNYLVKEFECRKSADSYARSSVSRTGVLECSKLHAYKYEEDLFKKISVTADGKNHGLVFILDWSGSMTHCMMDTLRQLYNLIWFCKKVQIPFDVYAFTNSYRYNHRPYGTLPVHHHHAKENDLVVDEDFNLLHFFSHKVKKAELDKQMSNIWRLAYSFDHNVPYIAPGPYFLSGTPLNETVICLHKLLPTFKKQNHVQKVHCVILTDGEAPPIPVYKKYYSEYKGKAQMGTRHLGPNSYLRNRKTGHTYAMNCSFYDFTTVLLEDLRQTFSDVNLIGIRIMSSRDMRQFISRYEGDASDSKMKKARKDKSYAVKGSGYHQYFGIIMNSLFNDTEFEVQEDASKTQIKSAFMKSLRSKSLNKKVLNQFVELIA